VRIFQQGSGNEQTLPLRNAINKLISELNANNKFVVFEWMSNDNMRSRKWTEPESLINWLLFSNAHIIVSQGLHMGTFDSPSFNWKIESIYEEILR
jgi:hypothetical protein